MSHDDKAIRQTVSELVHGELATRVRAKVQEKWGVATKDLPTTDDPPAGLVPRVTDVKLVKSPSGEDVVGIPDIVPSNVLLRVYREARTGAFQSWIMILGVNGYEIKVTYAISDVALIQFKSTSMGEHILTEMIHRGAAAVADLLRKGIAEDLLQMVKDDVKRDEFSRIFPFLHTETE